jgi:DNA-binding XRE family transcriptional regulator
MRQVSSCPIYTPDVYKVSIRSADIYTRRAIGNFAAPRDNAGMKNLTSIRKAKGLSQTELAEAVGIKQATVSRIEKGVNNPSLDVAEKIAEALGVNVVELFGLPELEQTVLQKFREASPERRAALLTLLASD